MIARLRRAAAARPRVVAGLRVATSVGLLTAMLAWLEPRELVAVLREADVAWLAVALVMSVPLVLVMAWRWSFTARRLGVALSLGVAWREYYVSTLLNSVLPGGVLGDVARVARHARGTEHALGPVARAVVLERAMGQGVQLLVLLLGAAALGLGDLLMAAVVTGLVAVGAGVVIAIAPGRWLVRLRQELRRELRAALLEDGALAVQLGSSLASVLLLVAMFWACAHAVGSELSPVQALVIVPWVLMATVLPITVGGWGVRELSAAALFPLVGLGAAEGAASAVLFGAVSLVSVLPGLWPLLLQRGGQRGGQG